MRINIDDLYNSHAYALAHGALPQQSKAFACLLWAAVNKHPRLSIELYIKQGREGVEAVESALVAIWDAETKRRVRAPLYRSLDLGGGKKMPLSRKMVVAICIEVTDVFELDDVRGGRHEARRTLTSVEIARLDERIQRAVGGRIPNVHEDAPASAHSHAMV